MTSRIAAFLVAASCVPIHAGAQEAYLQQVSAGGVTVALPQPQTLSLDAAQMTRTLMAGLAPARPRPQVDRGDLDAYPLVPAATTAAVADVTSVGNDNDVAISQAGLHAALVRQTGDSNMASLRQTGVGNRASIYQSGTSHSAAITQSGMNNRALIVQN
ncbi:MAG: hypothetical protein V2J12_13275 [Gammaproteobacteria bacterium]|jgi:hypothetical protein|nr:hypothetical protein [Gammaproteobacteria bacterium]